LLSARQRAGSLAPEPPRERIDNGPRWLRDWAQEHSLDIGPQTNYPRWEGEKPDYDLAASGLLTAS
jgi:hypothetical protein